MFEKRMPETKPRRNYVFKGESSVEHYESESFVVACVDDRFRGVLEAFLDSLGVEHPDFKTPAGGAKVFASPSEHTDREHYLRELGISIRLHHVKKVMLFSHHDCGAYGGFSKFNNSSDNELAFHRTEHQEATEAIKKQFPDLEVETYFIDPDGVIRTN